MTADGYNTAADLIGLLCRLSPLGKCKALRTLSVNIIYEYTVNP